MRISRAFLLRWHWQIGLAAAAFLFLIALTGLLLNHSRTMGLHHIFLDHPAILSAYNMNVPGELRGEGINLEKIILDFHTGKIFGLAGTVFSDLAALAVLFLSVTGIYNWWKRKKS